MENFNEILFIISMVPIYIAWASLLLFFVISILVSPFIATLFVLTKLSEIQEKLRNEIFLRDSIWNQKVEQIIESLPYSFHENQLQKVCACAGKKHGKYKVFVHIQAKGAEGSWVEKGNSEWEALHKLYAKHKLRGMPLRSGCYHDCPIKSLCPNRCIDSPFKEIFRRTRPMAA